MGFLVRPPSLGRPLVSASMTPPSSRAEAREIAEPGGRIAQGSVVGVPPPTSLDLITDRINELFDARTELDGFAARAKTRTNCTNALEGAPGTNPSREGQSSRRAWVPAPRYARPYARKDKSRRRDWRRLRRIRAYRPAATVFEADIAHAAKGNGLLAAAARKSSAMQAKRAAHDKHIDKAKEMGHGNRRAAKTAAGTRDGGG